MARPYTARSEAIAMVIATLTPLISGVHKLPRLCRLCGTSAHSLQLKSKKNSHHKTVQKIGVSVNPLVT